MMLWAAFAALAALVTAALLRARGPASALAEDAELAFYRAQIEALNGEITDPVERAEARAEIGRAVLRAKARAPENAGNAHTRWVEMSALGVPLLALALYVTLGSPDQPDQPLAQRVAAAPEAQSLDLLIGRLETRLRETPEDPAGWAVAAPAYMRLGRFEDAAAAYGRLITLGQPTAEHHAARAEALILAAGGQVGDGARAELDTAFALAPDLPRVRLWQSVRLEADGRLDEAEALLRGLRTTAAEPLASAIDARLAAIANKREAKPAPPR